MTTKVHAVYRGGVFLPQVPVPVAEGSEVELTVTVNGHWPSLAESLEEIARLPEQGAQDGFSGADHDQALYGSRESMSVFIDTGPWFASVVPSDPRHTQVIAWLRQNLAI